MTPSWKSIPAWLICDACGEEIVIPLDLAEGGVQTYVEDCLVCCRANTIHVEVDVDGRPTIRATPEQDYEGLRSIVCMKLFKLIGFDGWC